jgi:hypothetical protein
MAVGRSVPNGKYSGPFTPALRAAVGLVCVAVALLILTLGFGLISLLDLRHDPATAKALTTSTLQIAGAVGALGGLSGVSAFLSTR